MKNKTNKSLKYPQCSEDAKCRIEDIFSWTLKHRPYPLNIKQRIIWIHEMEEALRSIESEAAVLSELPGY
jgi:hypothetical protein